MRTAERLRIGHGVRAALLAVLIGGTISSTGQGFRQDEVECEEAVAHLSDCCDALNPRSIDCDYHPGGCDTEASYPSINPEDSQCIRGLSCKEILERGVCERLLERNGLATEDASSGARLCP